MTMLHARQRMVLGIRVSLSDSGDSEQQNEREFATKIGGQFRSQISALRGAVPPLRDFAHFIPAGPALPSRLSHAAPAGLKHSILSVAPLTRLPN